MVMAMYELDELSLDRHPLPANHVVPVHGRAQIDEARWILARVGSQHAPKGAYLVKFVRRGDHGVLGRALAPGMGDDAPKMRTGVRGGSWGGVWAAAAAGQVWGAEGGPIERACYPWDSPPLVAYPRGQPLFSNGPCVLPSLVREA